MANNDLNIVPLRKKGSNALSSLVAQVIMPLDYYSEEARRAEVAKYTAEALSDLTREEPMSVLVAEIAREPVGFCISKFDDGLIWLSWIGVAADRRHQGLAFELLRALEASARARGAHKLWCDSRTSNLASNALLEKFGFVTICTARNHWYGHDYYLWEKPLS